MVKSPKIYIRDTGILHALLHIESMNELLGHPVFGASWATLVIENVIEKYREWDAGFYRSSNGAEIDLVLRKGQKTIAIECKATTAPKLSRGFYSAMSDLNIDTAYVIAPVETSYPINEKVTVVPLKEFLEQKE